MTSIDETDRDWRGHIIDLENEACLAFIARDIERLDALFSDDLLINSPVNRVHDKRRVLDLLKSEIIGHVSQSLDIETIIRDGNLVTVMGADTVVNAPGTPAVQRRYTNVWRKERDSWRLFIRHANVIADQHAAS